MIYVSLKRCGSSLSEQRDATKELVSEMLCSLGYSVSSLKKDAKGRPYLQGIDADISISHSSELCAVAVLTEASVAGDFSHILPESGKSIGIDIEEIPSDSCLERYKRIAKRFLNADIIDVESFFCEWTKKEAYGKMIGDGLLSAPGVPCRYFTFTEETNSKKYILTISINQRMP